MAGAVAFGGAVSVEGLVEFQQSMRELDVTVQRDLNAGLRLAAAPVAEAASRIALEKITRIRFGRTSNWASFRVGATSGLVYVAPRQHGARGRGNTKSRPQFAATLITKAMGPAAVTEQPRVEAEVSEVLNRAFRKAGV